MVTPRLAAIPFEHVEAELAAFPIASEASFCLPPVALDPVTSKQKSLWRAAERDILASIPSISIDEFVAIRDRLWFGERPDLNGSQPRIPLVRYLRELSNNYLDRLGRPVEVSSQSTTNEGASPRARLRWSWLCRALPPDLLRTARRIGNADDLSSQLNPGVERLLRDSGFAETHLHLGAAADFSLIWANLMHSLAVEEVSENLLASPGASFDDGHDFAKWIMWASVTRLVLAEWLFGSAKAQGHHGLLDCTNAPWRTRLDVGMTNDLRCLISELARGSEDSLPLRLSRGRAIYRSLIRPWPFLRNRQEEKQRLRARRSPESREEVFENDPLARVVGWHGTCGSSPETRFVEASLRYMEESERDGDFDRLFWQVIRIRCLLYRHLVQRPLTPGLQWFVRFFSRIHPVRQSLPTAASMQAAIRQSGGGEGLRSLEVRVGTRENESECHELIQQVNNARSKPATLEIGAVFHFSRDRGGDWRKGFPNAYGLDHSYPGVPRDKRLRTRQDVGNPSGFRFARFYLQKRRHAQALVSVLRGFPCALRTLRGVDLCTDEAGVPIWVMAPLIRWVRESGQTAASTLRDQGVTGVPPLRITVHAGEDFVHLLTGLRRLDDAIQYLGLEEGDRIGHGIALGLDPVTWFERVGQVVQTKEERLFDLVWEWDCYANQGVDVGSERLPYLRSTIAQLALGMFGEPQTPEDLIHFVQGLHSEQELKAQGFPDKSKYQMSGAIRPEGNENNSQKRVRKYLCDTQVWGKGRALETITFSELGHEQEALRRLQGALRQKVGARGLTVEVNPSSNLMIADLGRLEEHPIWRLSPVHPVDDIPPVSVCIGSDDPLTFATTLPNEYQLLFDTIVLRGQSHEVALAWLDNARETGMRARFTLPRSITRRPAKLRPSLLQGQWPTAPP